MCPFAGESAGALEKRLRQGDRAGVVVAHRVEGDDGKATFFGLEANVGTVEMKPERRIKPQGCVSGNDQQQLVEGGDLGGSSGPSKSLWPRWTTLPIRLTANRGELSRGGFSPSLAVPVFRGSRVQFLRLTDPIHACDSDRPEPISHGLELLEKPPVPVERQVNVLVQADDPLVAGSLDSDVQPIRGSQAVLDQDDFVR